MKRTYKMRVFLICLILFLAFPAWVEPESSVNTFIQNFMDLDKTHAELVRVWCGWDSPKGPDDGICHLNTEKLQLGVYFQARKAAKRFFDLEDKKQ